MTKKIPLIKEYMVDNPYTVGLLETASAAEKIMRVHKIRHLPVVDGKKVVGMISDRDLMTARQVYKNKKFDGEILVSEVGVGDACLVDGEDTVEAVARKLCTQKIDAVVVVKDRIPVGIFTTLDAARLLAELFKSRTQTGGLWEIFFGRSPG